MKYTCFFFSSQKKIMLNTFLDTMMADPPPQCLVWLPLMHRLAHVENGKQNFYHPVPCAIGSIWTDSICNVLSYYHWKLQLTFAGTPSFEFVVLASKRGIFISQKKKKGREDLLYLDRIPRGSNIRSENFVVQTPGFSPKIPDGCFLLKPTWLSHDFL